MTGTNATDDLLSRLRALKPGTTVTRDFKPATTSLKTFTPPKAQTSREDILAARLKSLRNTSANNALGADPGPQPKESHTTTEPADNPRSVEQNEPEDEDLPKVLNIDLPTLEDSDTKRMRREIQEALEDKLPNLNVTHPRDLDDDVGLALPSVPLEPPIPSSPPRESNDADVLAARFSALQTPSSPPKASTDETDALNLPSVPVNKPTKFKRLKTKTNYTDEDTDTWCIVCLEDATLQCLDCEGSEPQIYCSRCWNEMHVGPMASYDDTTHRAVRFVRPQKQDKKKVAVGAS
ncbi:uncharacterized protein BROUX77_000852 [Berkeleyomyces rouxiae]|uniref:uncharacterized protein n=1 Tax=Berkeleyomyces rouxiae TaxID=2035830 RepID=UPI003B81C97E